jgi:uncharacterized membrane protein YebE (DUF533 family)
MSIQNLLNEFFGQSGTAGPSGDTRPSNGGTLNKLTGSIPGGLAGGAAAGGIVALLMGNKSARKFAGKAATYGGAAVLGGIAYKAFQNWQQNNAGTGNGDDAAPDESRFISEQTLQPAFELTLIKAMIAAAKADGHIDDVEHQRIIKAIAEMDISPEMKGMVFDLLLQQITVEELVKDIGTIEQKSEIYLASCLAINPDHPAEKAHLEQLSSALGLPPGLSSELQWQAQKAISAVEA